MSEETNLMSSLWPLAPSGATDWLLELCGDGITGFMPPAMPDAVWVLNAMYEHEQGPADVSYHEYHQARLADGSVQPHVVGGIDLDAVGIATGGGLGRAQHPGPGWRRLRWAELARRHGDPVVPDGLMPSYRCFPTAKNEGSWPLGMVPPTEGSLDRETRNRLIAILTQFSPGPDTRCRGHRRLRHPAPDPDGRVKPGATTVLQCSPGVGKSGRAGGAAADHGNPRPPAAPRPSVVAS
ncbi:hypothetical protein [Streptomyces sp. NPDC051994]|uniref:hypothetical protein n=1 Tax=unclassified Streptomyces TaxID=2593676 RepID=UPI0034428A63